MMRVCMQKYMIDGAIGNLPAMPSCWLQLSIEHRQPLPIRADRSGATCVDINGDIHTVL